MPGNPSTAGVPARNFAAPLPILQAVELTGPSQPGTGKVELAPPFLQEHGDSEGCPFQG